MRTQLWIKFIGFICILIGAIGIFYSSYFLSFMPFSELKVNLSTNVPLHIVQVRNSLRYLAILVNIIYFVAGLYFLFKKSFSFHLMYFALILSILHIVVSMIFLSPYSNNPTFHRYGYRFFSFIRPIIDISLLIGVFTISKNKLHSENGSECR